MKRYSNDPKKMSAKYRGKCPKCSEAISVGQTIYYWPSNRTAYCESCGADDFNKFLNAAQDEAMYSGTPYESHDFNSDY